MTKPLDVFLNLSIDSWHDIKPGIKDGELIRIGILPNGTVNGHPVIVMMTETAEGERFITQVTWQQFYKAFKAIALSPTIEMLDL